MTLPRKLHLACGPVLLPGWLNVDAQPVEGAVRARLPEDLAAFEGSSADFIYSSHFLEHLTYPREAGYFVKECCRILLPGGRLRLVVPGIENILRAYARADADFFAIQARLHPLWCTTPLEHLLYALQQDGEHKYGYDFQTLEKLLRGAGFAEVWPSDFNSSSAPEMNVDYRSIRDGKGNYLSLFVEAIK